MKLIDTIIRLVCGDKPEQPPDPPPPPVDVAAMLDDMAGKLPYELNWRTSIVDLLKLLHLESDYYARYQLADELGYTADHGSAAMNKWLHKEVMRRLEANGGKVPGELK